MIGNNDWDEKIDTVQKFKVVLWKRETMKIIHYVQ